MPGPGISGQSARGSYIAQADRGGVATVDITQVYQAAAPAAIDPGELAAASQRLEELPLDTVPVPAGLPPGSWMPLRRNVLFVGREADLQALASALKAGGTAAVGQSTALTGLGGVGKSQLASEFAYRYGQYFAGGVFWLSCADPAAMPAEIATCGRQLNLHADFTGLSLDAQVSVVAAAWHSELPRLLVFDNCEHEAVLETWLPRGGGCRVLVTSRRGEWRADLAVHAVRLGMLTRPESLELLCKHRPDLHPDDPVLDAIAHELGDLPLALHLAGSFLARYRRTLFGQPAAYLEAVQRPDLLAHRSLTIEGASPTGHEQHVARTFALSYEQLQPADKIDQMALLILALAAWFAAGEAIPRALLRASAEVEDADEAAVMRFEDGLVRLRELGLITEQEEGALALHRLLAAFVRSEAGDAAALRARVEAAVFGEAARLNAAGYPAPLLAWQPQLRFVAERAAASDSEHAGNLSNELGHHLRMIADFAGARAAYERALRIDEQNFGPDHPDVARDVNNLGMVLKDLGDLAGARAALERALEFGETNFGLDHPKVAIASKNLGSVLQDLGDFAAARAAYERALAINEKNFGPNHPEVGGGLNNLGSVLRELDDLAGAKDALTRSLVIAESSFGHDHPEIAIRLNNLGLVLKAGGDLAEARAVFERALKIDEGSFGPNHPRVAKRLNNLGSVLQTLGDLGGARAAYERALSICEGCVGPDHPQTAVLLSSLGLVLHALKDLAGARAAHERALAIGKKTLGLDHPKTATRLSNLGLVLQELGDVAGAREAFERALAIDETTFGPDHSKIATRLVNLGTLQLDLGDLAGARHALERAVAIDEASFGPEHPNVADSISRLGAALWALGDLAGARAAYERALSIFERVLGPDHPSTRTVRRNVDSLGGG